MSSCESTLRLPQLWAWRHSRHPIAYERGWYNGFTECRCVCQPLSAESVVLCVTQCIALVQDSTIVVEVVYSNSMLCDVIMLLLRVCWVKSLSDFRLIYFLGQINFFLNLHRSAVFHKQLCFSFTSNFWQQNCVYFFSSSWIFPVSFDPCSIVYFSFFALCF